MAASGVLWRPACCGGRVAADPSVGSELSMAVQRDSE